jgi:hypothetical protein
MSRSLGILVLASVALAGGACSSGQNGVRVGQCERDPERIAEERACVNDDHCPCGTHCVRGLCAADCTSDADCASGGTCDDFGRCRSPEEVTVLPAPPERALARVAVDVDALRVPADSSDVIRFRLEGGEGPQVVRLRATDGARVQCSEGARFTDECVIEDVMPGDEVEVPVQPPPQTEEPEPDPDVMDMEVPPPSTENTGQVEIHVDGSTESVSVSNQDPTDTTPPRPLEGVYGGSAILVASGLGAGREDLEHGEYDLVLPVTAEIFDDGTVAVSEPMRMLHADGLLVGTLDGAEEAVAFPAAPFFSGELAADEAYEMWVEAADATFRRGDRGTVALDVLQTVRGAVTGEAPLQLQWRILLDREGEPSGDAAPAVPADHVPALDPVTVATTPFALEEAFSAAQEPYAARTEPEREALEATVLGEGSSGWLDACPLDADARDGLGARLRERFLTGDGTPAAGTLADVAADDDNLLASLAAAQIEPAVDAAERAATTTSLTASGITDLDGRDIPCGLRFGPATINVSTSCPGLGAVDPALGDVDICDRLTTRTGCQPVEVSTGSLSVNVVGTLDVGGTCSTDVEILSTAVVQRVCRLPAVPPTCAEMVSCAEPTEGDTSRAGLEAPLAGDTLQDVGGDLRCASGGRALGVDVDAWASLPEDDPLRPTAAEVFDACASELSAFRAASVPTSPSANAAGLAEIFRPGACVDAARLVLSVAMATAPARAGVALEHEIDRRRAAYAQRLLSRWLQLHTFFAGETIEREQMAGVLRADPATESPPPAVEDVLALPAQGWDLLLHPRIATALVGLPAPSLADPDYRTGLETTGGEPAIPLAVVMVESLEVQLRLYELHLRQAARRFDPTAAEALSAALPQVLAARALSKTLAARGMDADPSAAWIPRYQAAERAFGTSLARALTAARAVRFGANPLGIEDEDLPLYFFSDTAGAGRRFSAISDFLIGSQPSDPAWAPTLVQQARESLDAARAAYLTQQDRLFRQRLEEAEQARRLDAVATEADAALQDLCGRADGSYVADPDFDASACFVADRPECRPAASSAYWAQMDSADLEMQLCIGRELARASDGTLGFADAQMAALADSGCSDPTVETEGCPSGALACVRCGGSVAPLSFATLRLRTSQPAQTAVEPGDAGTLERPEISETAIYSGFERDAIVTCRKRHPGARLALPGSDVDVAACVQGAIGEAALGVVAAEQDLAIARSEADDHRRAYDAAMQGCAQLLEDLTFRDQLVSAHRNTMNAMESVKLAMDIGATIAGAIKECTATLSGVGDESPVGAVSAVSFSAASCVAGGVEAGFNIASLSLGAGMEITQRDHEVALSMVETNTEVRQCVAEAGMELVGAQTAVLRVQRALTDVSTAYVAQRRLIQEADDTWEEAQSTLVRTEELAARPPDLDPWLDDEVSTFVRRMRLARRATYLAVRAVEYEYQQSMGQRMAVLTAETPDELEAVLSDLWSTSGTRSINGARPTDLKVVISLRDHLLQMRDESDLPPGEHPLTEAERFRLLLQSSRFAAYDEDGTYLGQRIPFSLVPLGRIGLGETEGISILAGNDCAERLWSVNASILGEEPLVRGSEGSFVRLDLLKQNTFYSQWCGGAPDDSEFQVASVRPSRNLFREPGVGTAAGVGGSLGVGNESRGFTRARMEAFFNISRAELESDDYANGDTSELASRGLYGQYALFIPAGVLSRPRPDGTVTDGLDLEAVDDILLRLDYVSVAR